MTVLTIPTTPIEGQKPGTSGLRKKTSVFMSRHYLENFVQAIFDATGGVAGRTLVLGGDGRHFGREAAQIILLWSDRAFASTSPLARVGETVILRPDIGALIRLAYDPALPAVARDPSHALRLAARLAMSGA